MAESVTTSSGQVGRRRETTDALKELILTRGLRPGDPLPTEVELVKMFDVSRSNLREAVRQLVAIDILEVRHGTGTFIGQMSLRPLVNGLTFKGELIPGDDFDALRQVIEVRMALDLGLAPGIVERLRGNDARELRHLCDEMAEGAQRQEPFADIDRSFHLALVEWPNNELCGQLVGAFWDVHTVVAPRLGVPTGRDLTDTALAHRAMLEAAIAGDLDAYRDAVHEHYAPVLRVLERSTIVAKS
ncbi:MAG: FCD domain-containing protein [Ilumatobacteraceae bacterium]